MNIRALLSLQMLVWALVCGLCGAASAQTLSVAMSNGTVSLPMYVAQANGYFQSQGLVVTTSECSSGRDCYRLMAGGTAQVATAAEFIATLNGFVRSDLAYIASLSTSSHQIKMVARRSAGIGQPSQMVGKRIGTVGGSSAEYFLSSWLLFYNIAEQDVTTMPMAPEQLVAALQNGSIDAVAVWDPIAASAIASLGSDGLVLPTPRVYTQHFGLLTSRGVVESREADLLKLLRALLQAERFIADQPLKAQQILMTRLGLDPAQAAAQMRDHDFRIRLDQSISSTMDSQARWAVRGGFAPPKSRPDDQATVIDPSLLRKLAPSAVTLVR